MSDLLQDQSARTRICSDLDRSLLVEAGAGSGKTHQMAARMAAGVASGTYAIERMAAVTFTRKAAAELRGRFQLALEHELASAQGDAAARVRHALANIERFFAGTIHAFCARLLRERPVEAGVSPGFTELDDVEERILRRQSWRDFRAQARATGDADLQQLDDADVKPSSLDEAFDVVCLYEDVDFAADDLPAPDHTHVWKALEEFWLTLLTYLPDPVSPDSTCRLQKAAVQFRRDWRFAGPDRRSPALLADLLRTWDCPTGITQKWWADDLRTKKVINATVPALHEQFKVDVVEPYLTAWRQYLYAPCVRVLMKARAHAAEERRRRNVLSFNDLLLLTARVLRRDGSVREALQQKYRHLFVDEFQDTDPIQAEIMRQLAGRDGTLFVVGDPKQSIYRFRRADIDVYNDMRRRLAGPDGAGVVALTTNFRSVPSVCDWANRVFQHTFPADADAWQPAYAPLVPRPGVVDAGPAVMTLTVPADVDRRDVCAEEADRIVRYITDEVAAGRRRYEDFLILTRKKKSLFTYAQALERRNVAIEVSGAGAFGDSPAVRQLSALLYALADPQDGVALVGVLRGPLFGLSDRELFAYRQAGGYFGLFSNMADPPPAARPVATALETLSRWFRWTHMLPAAAALDRLLEDSGFLALAASSPGGAEAGDLLHAVDRVRAAVEAGFTLAEVAESLSEDAEESSEVESLPLEPGRAGVVRVMNLHKAKGLEAPVVFLADPLGGFDPKVDVRIIRAGDAANAKDSLRAVGCFRVVEKFGEHGKRTVAEPPDWERHEADEQKYLDAEQSRLLYVAATRARDLLVVGRWAKGGGSSGRPLAWGAFAPFLAGVPELLIPAEVQAVAAEDVDLSDAAAAAAITQAEARHAQACEASWASTSVTAELKRLPRIATVSADEIDDDDPTKVAAEETPSRRADAGLAWGSLVHGLLEHAMRHPGASRDDLRRLAMWLTIEEPGVRGVIDRAIDTVEAVAASDRWRRARSSAEHHEEAPFSVVIDDNGTPTVVSGTIDLVYRDNDAWCVIDYKTDLDGAGSGLQGRYTAQVAAYERAWQGVTGEPVSSDVIPVRIKG